MQKRLSLPVALILISGAAANAQSLSSGFLGNTVVNSTGSNHGMMFNVTALNPGGITIDSFDIHSREAAGVAITVNVYTKQGTYVGFNTDPSAWTHVDTVQTVTAGPGQPTPLPVGGINIGANEQQAIYINVETAGGGQRYYSTATMPPADPVNDDLQIHITQQSSAVNGLWGSLFTPRGWNGTIHYTAHGQVITGACCLPDGSCEQLGQFACANAEGTFSGAGTDCSTIPPCPQPGACCLPAGGCSIMSEGQCANIGGTYSGNGSNCAGAACPGGACCLADGSCVFTTASLCSSTFSGTFNGDGTDCGDQRCATLPVLWNNGPTVTMPGLGCNGGDLSDLDQSVNTNTYGFGVARPTLAVADDFSIPAGETWTIEEIVVWGYQTGETTVTINDVGIQIWNGRPGDPGAAVVAGDVSANCLSTAVMSNIYRALATDPMNCDRRLQELTCDLNAVLGAGDYWVEITLAGSGASGPWISPVKFLFQPNKPFSNGMQRNAAGWSELIDGGAGQYPQDIPFLIRGQLGGSVCYANCDNSTVNPVLNVDDFTCFINQFAAAQALPHAQQVTHYANCDGSTIAPALNVDDFTCFINEYAQGCP